MPRYLVEQPHQHDRPECLGVLLANLGTPDAPTPAALRRFLAEFLGDPRVIEVPRALWLPILHGVILRLRPRRSAALYERIWGEDGSPLLTISKHQAAALHQNLERRLSGSVKVVLAMRYGEPSIAMGLERLRQANARRVLVLPAYPQYSATTTASTFDAVCAVLRYWRWLPEMRFVNQYHDHSPYIEALASSVRAYWADKVEPQRLLFSFHGIPRHYFDAGDPYFCQCQKTARLVAETLKLEQNRWGVSFQSRVGPRAWLKPYTDHLLKQWAREGIGRVDVLCPGFAADCLETLEEIAIQNRDLFLEAGGQELGYIPALNDRPEHIDALADLVCQHTQGWPETAGEWNEEQESERRQSTLSRARAMGAAG